MKKLSNIIDHLADEWLLRFAFTDATTHAWIQSKQGKQWVNMNFIAKADWLVLLPLLVEAGWKYRKDEPTHMHAVYFLERRNGD